MGGLLCCMWLVWVEGWCCQWLPCTRRTARVGPPVGWETIQWLAEPSRVGLVHSPAWLSASQAKSSRSERVPACCVAGQVAAERAPLPYCRHGGSLQRAAAAVLR